MKKRFIFDEKYIKRYAKKNQMRLLIAGGSFLVLILIVMIIMIANKNLSKKPSKKPNLPVYEIKENLYLESGSSLPEVKDYFTKLENIDLNSIKIIYPEEFEITYNTSKCSEEELAQIGENNTNMEEYPCVIKTLVNPAIYGISVSIAKKEHTVNLIIEDKTAPVVIAKEVEITKGGTYNIDDFASVCYDASGECKLAYAEELDEKGTKIDYANYKDVGEYEIKIMASDKYSNKTDAITTKLIIKEPDISTHTVTFNSNGGSNIENAVVKDNEKVIEPAAPQKEGYTFTGWYNGNNKFDFNTPITKDITLVAGWQRIGANLPSTLEPSSISLNFKTIYLEVGETKTVTASIYPSNVSNKNITWSSDNASIATVDNGKITGVAPGTANITAKTSNGKTATLTVTVRGGGSGTCGYGDASYNSSKYILSVNLTNNNCAVDPNISHNESVSLTDYQKLIRDLSNMGFDISSSTFTYKSSYTNVKNNAGTGLVGYQITIYVSIIDNMKFQKAEYIIKPDGTRQMISNNISKNGAQFN